MSHSAQHHAPEVQVRKRAARLSLELGTLILVGKFGAYWMTGSTAVLSDALESIVNVAAAGLLLYSVGLAAQPPDRNHPYGHGKVEFFSAGVEGTLIAVAAAVILVEAARELWRGPELQHLDRGLVLVGGLTALNAVLGAWLIRVGRRTNSLALEADGRHLMTDVATSVGVIAGLTAVWITGWVILDPLVAIAVALNILRTGTSLLREAVRGLMDEADEALLRRIAEALDAHRRPWLIDVHSLRGWRSGAVNHLDMHLSIPRYFDAERLHDVDEEVTHVVHEAAGVVGDVIVHFDPCRARQCPNCSMEGCPVRAAPFRSREPLTLERATRGDEMLETGLPVAGPEPA